MTTRTSPAVRPGIRTATIFRCLTALSLGITFNLPAFAQLAYTTSYSRTGSTSSEIGYTNQSMDYKNGAPYANAPNTFASSATSVSSTATQLAGASGTAYGYADAGLLKVYAKSSFPYDQTARNIQSYSTSQFFEPMVVKGGSGSKKGDPVQLQISMLVQGSITPTPQQIRNTNYNDFAYLLATVTIQDPAATLSNFQLRYAWGTGELAALTQPASLVTGTLNTFVGNTLYMTAFAEAGTYVSGALTGVPSAEVNFFNTAHFYVDGTGTTPDASVISTTGHNYSILAESAAPEAGSLPLSLCAILLWGGGQIARRRKRVSS